MDSIKNLHFFREAQAGRIWMAGPEKVGEVVQEGLGAVKNVAATAWEYLTKIGQGSLDGILDRPEAELENLVKNCCEAGLVFKIADDKIGPDGRREITFEVIPQKGKLGNLSSEQQDTAVRINKLLKEERERMQTKLPKAIITQLTTSFQDVTPAYRQQAYLAAETELTGSSRALTRVADKKLTVTASSFYEALTAMQNKKGVALTPEMESFVNLYAANGNGVIRPEQSLDGIRDAITERRTRFTQVNEYEGVDRWRDWLSNLPEKVSDNFFQLHPAEKLGIMVGLGVLLFTGFGNVKAKEWSRKALGWGTGIWLGSRLVTGKNPFELLGFGGERARKLYDKFTDGPEGDKIKKFLEHNVTNEQSVARMNALLVVGSIDAHHLLAHYKLGQKFDLKLLPPDQKELIQYVQRVDPHFDAEKEINELLRYFFERVPYDQVKAEYNQKDYPNLRFYHLIMFNLEKVFPKDIKSAAAAAYEKPAETSDFQMQYFQKNHIALEKNSQFDPPYFIGGLQVKITEKTVAGQKTWEVEFGNQGGTVQIGDITKTFSDTFRTELNQKIVALAGSMLQAQFPGLTVTGYNASTGEYQGSYQGWDINFEAHPEQDSRSNTLAVQVYVTSMKKGTQIHNFSRGIYQFNRNTGQFTAASVDTAKSGGLRGLALTPDNLSMITEYTQIEHQLSGALGPLAYIVTWDKITPTATPGSYGIKVTEGIELTADVGTNIFTFNGVLYDLNNAAQKTTFQQKIQEKLEVRDVGKEFTAYVQKQSGARTVYSVDPATQTEYLELPDYQIKIPFSSNPTAPNAVIINPVTKTVEKFYGNRNVDVGRLQETFVIPILEKELLDKDPSNPSDPNAGFHILSVNGPRIRIKYDNVVNTYDPSYMDLDINDLKRIKKQDGRYMTMEEYEKEVKPTDNLKLKVQPLKEMLKAFEGYEIKEMKYTRTMKKNYEQLVEMDLKIGTYEERKSVDRPKDRMLWDVKVTYDVDNAGTPSGTKEVKVEQLDGNPLIDNSTGYDWPTITARGMQDIIEKERRDMLAILEAFYNPAGGFAFGTVGDLYTVYPGGVGVVWLTHKNQLHALQNAGENDPTTLRAQELEQIWDKAVTDIVKKSDYDALYTGFHPDYQLLLQVDNKPTEVQKAVRYLLLNRYIAIKGGAGTFSAPDPKEEERLKQIHSVSVEECEMFLKYPAMIEIYANLLNNPFDINRHHTRFQLTWIPDSVKRVMQKMADTVHNPPFTEVMEETLGLLVFMDQHQFPAVEQLATQKRLIEAVKAKDAGAIEDEVDQILNIAEARTWYTTPTAYSGSKDWLSEKWDTYSKYFKIDK